VREEKTKEFLPRTLDKPKFCGIMLSKRETKKLRITSKDLAGNKNTRRFSMK